jgi:hypothetical protein
MLVAVVGTGMSDYNSDIQLTQVVNGSTVTLQQYCLIMVKVLLIVGVLMELLGL